MSLDNVIIREEILQKESGFQSVLFIDVPIWKNLNSFVLKNEKFNNDNISSAENTPDQNKIYEMNNLLSRDLFEKLEESSPLKIHNFDNENFLEKNLLNYNSIYFDEDNEDDLEGEDSETKASKYSKNSKDSKESVLSGIDNVKLKLNMNKNNKFGEEKSFNSINIERVNQFREFDKENNYYCKINFLILFFLKIFNLFFIVFPNTNIKNNNDSDLLNNLNCKENKFNGKNFFLIHLDNFVKNENYAENHEEHKFFYTYKQPFFFSPNKQVKLNNGNLSNQNNIYENSDMFSKFNLNKNNVKYSKSEEKEESNKIHEKNNNHNNNQINNTGMNSLMGNNFINYNMSMYNYSQLTPCNLNSNYFNQYSNLITMSKINNKNNNGNFNLQNNLKNNFDKINKIYCNCLLNKNEGGNYLFY